MGMNRTNGSKPGYRFTVAIIGGGFAGATLAAQVLRRSGGSISVVLVERGARVGRGVAYGTECGRHLLNVRAQNMSAYPDDPEHFLRWARDKHDPGAKPGDYLPRQAYGQYIAWLLEQENERHPGRLVHVQDEAIALDRDREQTEIRLRSGQSILAGKVVLALGNFPPGDPRLPGKTPHSQRYVCDPWAAEHWEMSRGLRTRIRMFCWSVPALPAWTSSSHCGSRDSVERFTFFPAAACCRKRTRRQFPGRDSGTRDLPQPSADCCG